MRTVKLTALIIGAAVAAAGAYAYVQHADRYPSTDDAYINADAIHVAAQVSGPITQVYVANQDRVHQGQRLFAVDRRPYQLAVDRSKAQLALAQQSVAQDEAAVASAQAQVHNRQVLLGNARKKMQRARSLAHKNYMARQNVDDTEAAFRSAQATLEVAQADLNEARKRLGTPGEQNERIREAQAALGLAQWNLAHTMVTADCDGRIAEFNLHVGDTAGKGQPLFVLICDHTFTVNANYKETGISRIRPGQPVEISVDMYPDHQFKGQVVSIGGASGVAFSLLPPQNATGNWVKVTQRVPVKIRFDDPDPHYPLRVGTSAVVTIDTTAQSAGGAPKSAVTHE